MSRMSLRGESYAVRPADQALSASLRKPAVTSLGLAHRRQHAGSPKMRVGFIGLDPIGQAMAFRLLKAGHQLTLYDPAQRLPEDLESAGGVVANSIQDACRCADAVFTMLPNEGATEEVILGPGGVVESLPGKAVHIGSSTVSVECSDRIVEAHWEAGKQYVSAPVLAYSNSTAEVQLFVIAGGHAATIIEIGPLISPIGHLAQLSGWPSDANLVQLDVSCSEAKLLQFLVRHPELGTRQERSQLASLTFLDIETNLDIETEGVLR